MSSSKPTRRVRGGAFEGGAGERVDALRVERGADVAQHLDEERAGAAARVEHDDALVGEPASMPSSSRSTVVDAGDHVADDLRGRVPDAEVLAEDGVVLFEERLVEVLDGLGIDVEAPEEPRAVDAPERLGGPLDEVAQVEHA